MVVNKIYLSGIQPTGKLHLGNYFGCIKPFLKATTTFNPLATDQRRKHLFLIADLHCFTKPENIHNLRTQIIDLVRSLIALGVDLESTAIIQQSKILEHSQLAWYLSCLTRFSRAENMTQFKDNRSKYPNVGLFSYPILQAADILLYRPDVVIVGPDQKQHLELMSELCEKVNCLAKERIFKKPEIEISPLRVKSFDNELKKMSKSELAGCIFLSDPPEIIESKIKKAKTDSIASIEYDPMNRQPLANIIEVLANLRNTEPENLVKTLKCSKHLQLKMELSKEISDYFSHFREKYTKISDEFVTEIIENGNSSAKKLAQETMAIFSNSLSL